MASDNPDSVVVITDMSVASLEADLKGRLREAEGLLQTARDSFRRAKGRVERYERITYSLNQALTGLKPKPEEPGVG